MESSGTLKNYKKLENKHLKPQSQDSWLLFID